MINFLNVVKFFSVNGSTPIKGPCQDQLVGKLQNGTYTGVSRVDIDYVINSYTKTISNSLVNPLVIVLESPHKAEFNKMGKPLGPAMGATGILFKNEFQRLISGSKLWTLINNSIHDIVMINAVQYQCSLGLPITNANNDNKMQRDKNWLYCFNTGCSTDVKDRIQAIAPFAVINLCTKSLSNLSGVLAGQINSYKNYTSGTHPSTWNFKSAIIH